MAATQFSCMYDVFPHQHFSCFAIVPANNCSNATTQCTTALHVSAELVLTKELATIGLLYAAFTSSLPSYAPLSFSCKHNSYTHWPQSASEHQRRETLLLFVSIHVIRGAGMLRRCCISTVMLQRSKRDTLLISVKLCSAANATSEDQVQSAISGAAVQAAPW